jgi:hypothetical protein
MAEFSLIGIWTLFWLAVRLAAERIARKIVP